MALVTALAIDLTGAANADDLWQLPPAPVPALSQVTPTRSCESFNATRVLANATVREARVVQGTDGASESCRMTIEVTNPSAPNVVTVWVELPTQHWNGRFLGLGGGGWLPGFPAALAAGASLGFATVITNAGRPYDLSIDPQELGRMVGRNDFLLNAQGRLDWTELQNFAYRGIHEMTIVGKAVTGQFYGVQPRYAYFSGCSTGGRQGQAEVQRYPQDYDGVLSGSPAINWAHFAAAESWPLAVTREFGDVPQCKLDAAHRAAVAACDGDDGARDGLVSGVGTCRFDAKALVGTHTECGVIDAREANVIGRIWEGPRRRDGSPLWNGIDRAALIHAPQAPPSKAGPFSEGEPPDATSLSLAAFEPQFDQFVERYGAVMDTSSPDLDAFAKHGKTILWHGVADDIIPAAGTVHYVDSIRRTLGESETDNFLRFYVAPGVKHCGGGDGPQPVALLEPLMEWVEQGRAPKAVRSENRDPAGRITRTRPLCPYPALARYRGRGSLDDAASFRCER
ncbi:MAG TPA: tannase/feruloyl esterase family alpha/beta hydrolase [Steroidobacteraceae bacterium]